VNSYKSYYNNILQNADNEHYLRIIKDDVECLDCIVEILKEEEEEEEDIITEETTTNEESSEVNQQINKDAINTEVNDN